MPLSPSTVLELVNDQLLPAYTAERMRLDAIDLWYRHENPEVDLPTAASLEALRLRELARTPWLGLVVSTLSQATLVDGYKQPDQPVGENSAPWRTWLGNKMNGRQVAIHRAAYAYGYSFGVAWPGVAPDGTNMAVLRGKSPRQLQAFYDDPAEDDWPTFALEVKGSQVDTSRLFILYDDEAAYYVGDEGKEGGKLAFIESRVHPAGVCPVVRYAPTLDLEGRADGRVEPFITVAARINKTDYDRLLAQHYNSWKVKTIAGITLSEDDRAADAEKLRLRNQDILTAEDHETRFGTLDETQLNGFIEAKKDDVMTLAAVSQTPTHALTGDLVNLSADALASARAQFDQQVGEFKAPLGDSHAQLLRLGATMEGNIADAQDIRSAVSWQDTSIRSLNQAADALGKLAAQLRVPVEALWQRIPGVTKTDVEEWVQLAQNGDPLTALGDRLEQQAAGLADAGPGA